MTRFLHVYLQNLPLNAIEGTRKSSRGRGNGSKGDKSCRILQSIAYSYGALESVDPPNEMPAMRLLQIDCLSKSRLPLLCK